MPPHPDIGPGQRKRKLRRGQKAPPKEIVREQRKREILDLRVRGWTFDQIGQSLTPKLTKQRVQQIVDEALSEIRLESEEHARKLAIARAETLLPAVLEKAENGDLNALGASLQVLKFMSGISGIEAPTKIEQSGPNGGPIVSRVVVEDAARSFDAKAAMTLEKLRKAREAKGE